MDHFHLHVSTGALCVFALMFLGVLWLIAYGIGCYTKRAEVKPPFRTTGYVRASNTPTSGVDYHWSDPAPVNRITTAGYYGESTVRTPSGPSGSGGPSTLSTMGSSFAGSLAGNLVADALTGHESSNNVSDSSNSDPFGGSGVDFSSNSSDTSGFSSCDSGSSASFGDSGGGGFDCSF